MELLKSAAHPTEVWALLKFKFGGGKDVVTPSIQQVLKGIDIVLIYLWVRQGES